MEVTKAQFPTTAFINAAQRQHETAFNRFAIKQFCNRKKHSQSMPKHDICQHCGIISDIVAEDYLFPPKDCCSQCQGLLDAGLMYEAKFAFSQNSVNLSKPDASNG